MAYVSLSTANLPDPAINNAENKEAVDHFDTVLYTGTGSTTEISSLSFQPDWLWFKRRSSSDNHTMWDAVRGANKVLKPNESGGEGTDTTQLSSFDDDGFTLLSGGDVNASSVTFAAWCWNAGGTEQTATYVVKVVSDSGNKYRFDDFGSSAITLELSEGGTYRFDQSDSSNSGHPLRFSTTSNGTHGGGSEYTTGVTTNGTPGSAGAYTEITVAADAPTLYYYCSVHSGMGGQANTPSTKGYTNVKGTIQSKVVVNDTAGVSIVSYSGSGSDSTVGHGLSAKPEMFWIKNRDRSAQWSVYHKDLGATKFIELSTNAGEASDEPTFNNTEPTATVFSVGSGSNGTNASGEDLIAYCFHSVDGFSRFGSYDDAVTGSDYDNTSPFVYTGFRPAFLMIKGTTTGRDWVIYDSKRTPDNGVYLTANQNSAEQTDATNHDISFLSNGFKIRGGSGDINTTNESYVYMAFADQPFKFANGGTE